MRFFWIIIGLVILTSCQVTSAPTPTAPALYGLDSSYTQRSETSEKVEDIKTGGNRLWESGKKAGDAALNLTDSISNAVNLGAEKLNDWVEKKRDEEEE